METDVGSRERRIYTISELTERIKSLLENKLPFVWVVGEISNFHTPVSGHFYFSLKDTDSQIRAVMFRGQNRALKFRPEDGLSVIGMGRINVYEPRGVYQIIIEYLEPEGVGVLQLAFEQLKAKLAAEGLFDDKHKQGLPFLPQRIGVATSPTGAVIRDILHVIDRRYPNIELQIAPVRVQGDGADEEIGEALRLLNDEDQADVIIVARGGGSLEDMQAFNSEVVARAVFASLIPVVSAVGHETDVTISDFVADLRAPTPSAAVEMILPVKEELLSLMKRNLTALENRILQKLRFSKEQTAQVSRRLVHPRRQISDYRLRLDDGIERIVRGFSREFTQMLDHVRDVQTRLWRSSPLFLTDNLKVLLKHQRQNLSSAMQFYLGLQGGRFDTAVARLNALSPLSVLERGYSVTRVLPSYAVVKDVDQVSVGQRVELTVSRGAVLCRVERKQEDGEANI